MRRLCLRLLLKSAVSSIRAPHLFLRVPSVANASEGCPEIQQHCRRPVRGSICHTQRNAGFAGPEPIVRLSQTSTGANEPDKAGAERRPRCADRPPGPRRLHAGAGRHLHVNPLLGARWHYTWGMRTISYARHRFPPDVIRHAVWLYLRFTLSYRDVEDLLAERGFEISNETIRRWVLKFGPAIARILRRGRRVAHDRWHLDEMVVSIAGRGMYMWRAVDSEGEVLDVLVQRRRDKAAALNLLRKLLKRQGFAPTVIVTDKLRS